MGSLRVYDEKSKLSFLAKLDNDTEVNMQLTIPDSKLVDLYVNYDSDLLKLHCYNVNDKSKSATGLTAEEIYSIQTLSNLVSKEILEPLRLNKNIEVAENSSLLFETVYSFFSLLSNAPAGSEVILSFESSFSVNTESNTASSADSLCEEIGNTKAAIYSLSGIEYTTTVTVGPSCYQNTAFGRCGAGAGPDQLIGYAQRFTQNCLNHDECCAASQSRYVGPINLCGYNGTDCLPEFLAAAPDFFFGQDCATTTGTWNLFGLDAIITGGDNAGTTSVPFSGYIFIGSHDDNSYYWSDACVWGDPTEITNGYRSGKNVEFITDSPFLSCGPGYYIGSITTDTVDCCSFDSEYGEWCVTCINRVSYQGIYSSCDDAKGTYYFGNEQESSKVDSSSLGHYQLPPHLNRRSSSTIDQSSESMKVGNYSTSYTMPWEWFRVKDELDHKY